MQNRVRTDFTPRGHAQRRLCIAAAVLLTAPAAPAHAQADFAIRHRVMLVSLDGLRPDAIDAADAAFLRQQISRGAYTAFCRNEFPPATLPNHTTMLTGLPILTHGIFLNAELPGHVANPTLLDMATGVQRRTGFFASKVKFNFLCRPEAATVRVIEPDIDKLTDQIVAFLEGPPPDFMFIHYNQPDGAGHAEGWMSESYLAEVRHVDALLRRVCDTMARRGLDRETVVIVTADHGGEGKSHALNTDLERNVPLLIFGPDVAAGHVLRGPNSLLQIAPTCAALLGLDAPTGWQRRIPLDAFVSPQEPAAQARAETGLRNRPETGEASLPSANALPTRETSDGPGVSQHDPAQNLPHVRFDAVWPPAAMILVGGALIWISMRRRSRRSQAA